jgi:LysM repeat protein
MKKRFDIVDLIIMSIIACVLTLVTINVLLGNKNNDIIWIDHIVKQGENLTQIADKYSNEYTPKAIYNIKKDNNLKNSSLEVGQVLKIRGDM